MLRKGHIKENDLWPKLGNSLLSLIVFIETNDFVAKFCDDWCLGGRLVSLDLMTRSQFFSLLYLFKINIKAFFCTFHCFSKGNKCPGLNKRPLLVYQK